MHYDYQKGVKHLVGIFSKLTVVILALALAICGLYLTIDYLAPEIFEKSEAEKTQIKADAENQPVAAGVDKLRIPFIGLNVDIVDKNTDDKVQITRNGQRIILSGKSRNLGLTPPETLRLSPLALLKNLETGQQIFMDLAGERTIFKVVEIKRGLKPNVSSSSDLTIYALNQDNSLAETAVLAEKTGKLKLP